MSVKYSLSMRINPRKPNDPRRCYAQAQSGGELTFDELCDDVAERCTITRADIAGCIEAVLVSISHSLRKGEVARFGEFGSFQVNVQGKGVLEEKDFNPTMIKRAHIVFRPGKMLTNLMKTLEYTQVPKLPIKTKKDKPAGKADGKETGK